MMHTRRLAYSVFACLLALATPLAAHAQATAPLTHDRHTHKHNPDHPTQSAEDSQRFHTDRMGAALALPTEQDMFSFVVYGDRTGGPKEGVNVLAQAVADTNLLEPDLVMTVGDLIEGYNTTPDWLKQKDQFKSIMGELICPWFPVAGNHDVYWRSKDKADVKPEGEHEKNYEMHFGPLWYAFEHKGCFFIALYTDEGNPKTGEKNFKKPDSQRMSDEQFNWLKKILAKAKDAQHVFVFLHHPRWIGANRHAGYGDDWGKVHQELVKAGNVSGVFAGHIHHMRYDPKDGINYFSLATVGGGQPGWSAAAGYLHQFHIVTVRKSQVAFASVPVGEIHDPKLITGDVSEQSERLARASLMTYENVVKIKDDGSVSETLKVKIENPSTYAIDIALAVTSKDSRWSFAPSHTHAKIKPGESQEMSFKIKRQAGVFDASAKPIVMELGIDLLTDRMRYPIRVKRVSVPGSVRLDP